MEVVEDDGDRYIALIEQRSRRDRAQSNGEAATVQKRERKSGAEPPDKIIRRKPHCKGR
jgi:hypothetical protein